MPKISNGLMKCPKRHYPCSYKICGCEKCIDKVCEKNPANKIEAAAEKVGLA